MTRAQFSWGAGIQSSQGVLGCDLGIGRSGLINPSETGEGATCWREPCPFRDLFAGC